LQAPLSKVHLLRYRVGRCSDTMSSLHHHQGAGRGSHVQAALAVSDDAFFSSGSRTSGEQSTVHSETQITTDVSSTILIEEMNSSTASISRRYLIFRKLYGRSTFNCCFRLTSKGHRTNLISCCQDKKRCLKFRQLLNFLSLWVRLIFG
jgi:hypothetical protein